MTMVDFGIFGFLIPLVNLLYTNTSIPTGESSYCISIGVFMLFTETGGKTSYCLMDSLIQKSSTL